LLWLFKEDKTGSLLLAFYNCMKNVAFVRNLSEHLINPGNNNQEENMSYMQKKAAGLSLETGSRAPCSIPAVHLRFWSCDLPVSSCTIIT
jgi:hypothetical protein